MTDTPQKATGKLDGTEKLLVEMGPLLVFFVGLFFHSRLAPVVDGIFQTDYFNRPGKELFLGLAMFLPAFAVAFVYSIWKTKRAAPMLIVTGVITGVMAILTFVLDSKQFIYMKPTIIYGLVGALLAGGLLVGKNFLKTLFDGAFEMPDHAWRTLTWRLVAFNILAAIVNEIAWRSLTADCVADLACGGEKTWFTLKAFGFPIAYVAFMMANMPLILKHAPQEQSDEESSQDPS